MPAELPPVRAAGEGTPWADANLFRAAILELQASGGGRGGMAYQGLWSNASAYAIDDVVLDAGRPFIATAEIAAGGSAPSGTSGSLGGANTASWADSGDRSGGTGFSNWSTAFTVNEDVTVTQVSIVAGNFAGIASGVIGIAEDFSGTADVPWLGKGTFPGPNPGSGASAQVTLDVGAVLVPGVTYRVVYVGSGVLNVGTSTTGTGSVAGITGNSRTGPTFGSLASAGWHMVFALTGIKPAAGWDSLYTDLPPAPDSITRAMLTDEAAGAIRTVNTQTGTSYTLVLGDAGNFITMTNAAASTLTVPPNSSVAFPVGTLIEGAQLGAGQVTLTPGSGVTINATPGLKVAAQYGTFGLLKLATDTWLAYGRLAA